MIIEAAAFFGPIAPANGVDGTVLYVNATLAELSLEGAFLRVTWKASATPSSFRFVPLSNVRELHCVPDDPATAPTQPNARVSKPEPGPKPKAR